VEHSRGPITYIIEFHPISPELTVKRGVRRTAWLTGISILAALVIVFDYTLKFSGLKIPFPWMPFLKFDFTGVPIALSLLLYGLPSGAFTSIVAFVAIVARSGELVGAMMKGIAEFSTISGMALVLHISIRHGRFLSILVGIVIRTAVMSLTNLIVLPSYYGLPYNVVINMLPLLGLFNAMQGAVTVLIGYALCEAYERRVSSFLRTSF